MILDCGPIRKPLDSIGTIARSRLLDGQHATPAEGFAIDADALDRATAALLQQAEDEGWSVDMPLDAGP